MAGTDPRAFLLPHSKAVQGLDPLAHAAAEGYNYYYCSWEPSQGFFTTVPHMPSQKARRVWADLVGSPDQWDWALFPHFDNCRITASVLRQDMLELRTSRQAAGGSDPTLEETLRTYSHAADWYVDSTRAFSAESSLTSEIRMLAERTTGWVLDAGSGSGRDALYFASLGRNVVALDAATALVDRTPHELGVHPVAGDVRSLPLQDDSVGAVWCSAVLVHMESDDVLRSLREFERVLQPGGLALISVKEGTGHTSEPVPGDSGLRRHFFYYELADLDLLSSNAEFQVVDTWKQDEVDGTGTQQRWIKLLLRNPA